MRLLIPGGSGAREARRSLRAPCLTAQFFVLLLLGVTLAPVAHSAINGTLYDIQIQADDPSAAATSTYRFQFTIDTTWPSSGKVRVYFPEAYPTQSTSEVSAFIILLGQTFAAGISVSGKTITATRLDSGHTVKHGEIIGLILTNIRNPTTAGSSGDFFLETLNPSSNQVFDSATANGITVSEPATRLGFLDQPASTQAGQTLPALRVAIQDASGATVTHRTDAITIGLSTGPSGASLLGTRTRNAIQGIATFDDLILTQAGAYVLSASVSGLTSAPSASFDIVAGPLVRIAIQPIGAQVAGTPFAITVTAYDAYGNAVTNHQAPLHLTADQGSITPSQADTWTNGVATPQVDLTRAGQRSLTLTTADITATSNVFTLSPGPLHTFQIQAIDEATAGTPLTLSVTARDAFGNTIPSYTGTPSLTAAFGNVTPDRLTTWDQGVSNPQVTLAQAGAEQILTIQDQEAFGTSNAFLVSAGPLASYTVTCGPDPATVGEEVACTTSQGQDAYGNLRDVGLVTWTAHDASGAPMSVSELGVLVAPQQVERAPVTITASAQGIQRTATVDLQAGPLYGFDVTCTPSPATVNEPVLCSVDQGRDSYGNPQTLPEVSWSARDAQGTWVTIGADGAFNAPTATSRGPIIVTATAGTTSQQAQVRLAAGPLASFLVSCEPHPATAASAVTCQAHDGQDAFGNPQTIATPSWTGRDATDAPIAVNESGAWTAPQDVTKSPITITATSGTAQAHIEVPLQPAPLHAFRVQCTPSPATVAQTVECIVREGEDAYGNPVPLQAATWTLEDAAGASLPITGGSFLAPQRVTQAPLIVTATIDGASATQTVQLQAGPLASFTVQCEPQVATVASLVTCATIDGRDAYDNPQEILSTTWSLSDAYQTPLPIEPSGTFQAPNRADQAPLHVRATSASVVATAQVGLQAGPLFAFEVSCPIQAAVASLAACVASDATDQYGNPRSLTTIDWSAASVDGTPLPIDANGSVTLPTRVEDGPVYVGAFTENVLQIQEIQLKAAALHHFGFSALGEQTAGQDQPVQITAYDAYGNVVLDHAGSATLSAAFGPVAPSLIDAWDQGVASLTVRLTRAHAAQTLTVQQADITGTSQSFVVSPAEPATITFIQPPLETDADTNITFDVSVQDAFDNTVPTQVSWTLLEGTGSVSDEGVFSPDLIGSSLIQARAENASATTLIHVTPGLPTILSIQGPAEYDARHGAPVAFLATAYDANGNQVPLDSRNDVTWSLQPEAPAFDANVFNGSLLAPGTYVVHAQHAALSATHEITINHTNEPPHLTPIHDRIVPKHTTLRIQVEATDPDGDELTYSATDLPAGASLDASTGLLTWTPGRNAAGIHRFNLTVSDGLTDTSQTVRVEVYRVPAILELSGTPSLVTSLEPFALSVRVLDRDGQLVTNASHSILLYRDSGPFGSLLGGTRRLDAQGGLAAFDDLFLDKAGVYTIRALAHGLREASSPQILVEAGAPSRLAFDPSPSGMLSGDSFTLRARLLDAAGNTIPVSGEAATLSIADGPQGGVLQGELTRTSDMGVFHFQPNLTGSGVYVLRLASDREGVEAGLTQPITIQPRATHLAFASLPSAPRSGQGFSLSVVILDESGQRMSNASHRISLTADGPGTLRGSLAQNAVQGLARFDGLTLDRVGEYRFTASASGLPNLTSAPIQLAHGTPHTLQFDLAPAQRIKNQAFSLQVRVLDQAGNLADTGSLAITLTKVAGPGQLLGTRTQSSQAGVADFSDLLIDAAGTHRIAASAPGTTAAISSAFTINPLDIERVHHLHLEPEAIAIQAGYQLPLTLVAHDADHQPIAGLSATYRTIGDARVGLVNATGVFFAIRTGTIQVEAQLGLATTTSLIVVVPGPLAQLRVQPEAISLSPGTTGDLVALGSDAFGNDVPLSGFVEWTLNAQPPLTLPAHQPYPLLINESGVHRITARADGLTAHADAHVTSATVATGETLQAVVSILSGNASGPATSLLSAGVASAEADSNLLLMGSPSTGSAPLVYANVSLERASRNLAILIETQLGGLDQPPPELDVAHLVSTLETIATQGDPVLYVRVTAIEGNDPLPSYRLNELLGRAEVEFLVPMSYFVDNHLDPARTRLIEYSDGSFVTHDIFPTLLSPLPDADGNYHYRAVLEQFSTFAMIGHALSSAAALGSTGSASYSAPAPLQNAPIATTNNLATVTRYDGTATTGLPPMPPGVIAAEYVNVAPAAGGQGSIAAFQIDLPPERVPTNGGGVVLRLLDGKWVPSTPLQMQRVGADYSGLVQTPCCGTTAVAFDIEPPALLVPELQPFNGRQLRLAVDARDNLLVDRVEFYVNGVLVTSRTSGPYELVLDTNTLRPGPHAIRIVAYDMAGNQNEELRTALVRSAAGAPVSAIGNVAAPQAPLPWGALSFIGIAAVAAIGGLSTITIRTRISRRAALSRSSTARSYVATSRASASETATTPTLATLYGLEPATEEALDLGLAELYGIQAADSTLEAWNAFLGMQEPPKTG